MSVTRVKVEARRLKNDTPYEREKNFRALLREFNKRVDEAGIKHQIKEHQYYESKGEKARKKKKEAIRKHQQEKIFAAIERGETPKGALRLRGKSQTD